VALVAAAEAVAAAVAAEVAEADKPLAPFWPEMDWGSEQRFRRCKVLQEYFEFLDSGEIRIKGTRVGLEIVLRDYLLGAGPEEIVLRYPTLSLEQVHAAILYYLQNTDRINQYLRECWQLGEEAWMEQQRHPSQFVQELRRRMAERRRSLREAPIGHPTSVVV
jgi:uncharacterized protein (DUF433 family)